MYLLISIYDDFYNSTNVICGSESKEKLEAKVKEIREDGKKWMEEWLPHWEKLKALRTVKQMNDKEIEQYWKGCGLRPQPIHDSGLTIIPLEII